MAHLRKLHDQGFGFSVRGDGPIIIAGVDGGSIADVIEIFKKLYEHLNQN